MEEPTRCVVNPDLRTDISDRVRSLVGCDKFDLRNVNGFNYCPIHNPQLSKVNEYEFRSALETIAREKQPCFKYGVFPSTAHLRFLKLSDADFGHCRFANDADFQGAHFTGIVSFRKCTFSGRADFSSSRFLFVDFEQAVFENHVGFTYAVFEGSGKGFERTHFRGSCSFRDIVAEGNMNFLRAEFEEKPDFLGADFNRTTDFVGAKFRKGASFSSTRFDGPLIFQQSELFDEIRFSGSQFYGDVLFNHSTLHPKSRVYFDHVSIQRKVDFRNAEMEGFVRFVGGGGQQRQRKGKFEAVPYTHLFESEAARLSFEEARISPSARLSFDTVRLEPHWFLGVDPKDFTFSNISWNEFGKKDLSSRGQFMNLSSIDNTHATEAVARACRRIAANYEEFAHFERASYFRNFAFEAEDYNRLQNRLKWKLERKRLWSDGIRCTSISEVVTALKKVISHEKERPVDIIAALYGTLSKFGESWLRAAICLFVLYIAGTISFAVLGAVCENFSVTLLDAPAYTLKTMLFQKPEPKPQDWATAVEIALLIFSPIQAALLTLAIRRKFLKS